MQVQYIVEYDFISIKHQIILNKLAFDLSVIGNSEGIVAYLGIYSFCFKLPIRMPRLFLLYKKLNL